MRHGDEGLALSQSLADNLWLPCLSRRARHGMLSGDALERDAQAWLEKVGVKFRSAGQAIRELSGGNQQKVALARLLAANCDVLLLDEPTRGVDVGAKAEIYKVIDELAHVQNKAVLVISSYLPELLGLADRVAVGGITAASKGADYRMRDVIKNIAVHPIFTQTSKP